MNKKVLVFFLFFYSFTFAQKKYAKEISFVTENDLYTSTYDDRYYTNGMFLSYKYVTKEKGKHLEKKIFNWEIGHKMFTPSRSILQNVNDHDRSFAAYLYGSFGIKKIYKNKSSFATNFQVGVLGPSAFGEELQDFIHTIYGFREAVGWQHQIKNALGLNLNLAYQKFLFKDTGNHFDVTWLNSGNVGTINTDISTGFMTRIGFKPLENFVNSIAFGNHLNNKTTTFFRTIESFLLIQPTLRYALYDATLQGSFLNTGSDVTSELIPLVFNLEVGFLFTANRVNFGYTYNYNSSKSQNLNITNGHTYGSIRLNYLLQ